MQIREFTKKITTSTTTTVISSTVAIRQLVISCADAGSGWTIAIKDKGSPVNTLIPAFEPALPTNGGLLFKEKFDDPLFMDGGIDIITASGTPGEISVWIALLIP